ncbi:helix-turn-helix domain-containing protein [Ramlibacter tataouinensis]|uniref:HTH cro/C1-type domain-containing protein n=1 Tax=Ramlibacter tataouinensis (strain ATCC BAA-407 / DSM 14655 / LMG 21543 / TTB310) TaxID=365046 RepID=F5XY19_RAMTT|nr:helix-turn-helix transcriptional regulator [Ramlibacter tataouinensis]AEG94344.1 hypothetical protein Rta_32320 [Ramlibacter tataouinensis TTB310]
MLKRDSKLRFNKDLFNRLMIENGYDSAALSRAMHRSEGYAGPLIDPRNIQRWRNGEVNPNIGFVKRIAEFFGVPLRGFLVEEDLPVTERCSHDQRWATPQE